MCTNQPVTREELEEKISKLSDEDLVAVSEFIAQLEREADKASLSREALLLSHSVLRRELETPDEDEAWRYLAEEV